jgi:hypothetical protein
VYIYSYIPGVDLAAEDSVFAVAVELNVLSVLAPFLLSFLSLAEVAATYIRI